MDQQPLLASFELEIPKVATEGLKKLKMEIKASMVLLSPPSHKSHLPALVVYGIAVKQAGTKGKGLEWRLISTLPVHTADEAKKFVKWYSCRWRIERLHYILKSGCRIEELQLRNIKALRKAVLVYSLCAFKIMQMLYLSRTEPSQSCTNFFSGMEWKVISRVNSKSPINTPHPPTLQKCVWLIAKLGGYIGRNNDGPPGIKNFWNPLPDFHPNSKLLIIQSR